jgi:hypothetical protein
MAPPLLTLKDIHLTFGGTPLLEGAELTVAPGDRIFSSAATARASRRSSRSLPASWSPIAASGSRIQG